MRNSGQSGITLAELLVASAIGLAIAACLGTAIFQFIRITNQGNEVMTALHQVQNAGYWVSLDGQKSVSASGGSDLVLTIPNSATVTYATSGTELIRTCDGSQFTIARDISNVGFQVDKRIITMNVTASPGNSNDTSEQATYKVCLRPEGGG